MKRSFLDEHEGIISINRIEVNMAESGCSGDNCHPAKESDYNNNKWPGSYKIPDTVNNTLEPVSNIVEGKDLNF